jgi:hypothetical protein
MSSAVAVIIEEYREARGGNEQCRLSGTQRGECESEGTVTYQNGNWQL